MLEVTRRTFLKVAGAAGAAMLAGCKVVEDEAGTPGGTCSPLSERPGRMGGCE
jgi:hypothetical protein